MMLPLLLLLFTCACAVYWLARRRCDLGIVEPPTAAGSWPIMGYVAMLLSKNSSEFWISLKNLMHLCLKNDGVISFSLGPVVKVYMLTDPEDSLTVLNSCLTKDLAFYKFLVPLFGEGIFNGPVSIWRLFRKHLLPTINQRDILDSYVPCFNCEAKRLVKDLTAESGRGHVDIFNYIKFRILETVCLTICDGGEDDLSGYIHEYLEGFTECMNIIIDRMMQVQYYSNFIYKWSSLKRKENAAMERMKLLCFELIRRKKAALENCDSEVDDTLKSDSLTGKTAIDMYFELCDKGALTENQLVYEINSVLFGGHDTVSHALMYTIVLLGSHQDVQDRLYTEIQNVFGNSNADVSTNDLSRLVYMEAVIKESMRLYTVAPVVARHIDENIKLKKYTLLAGRTAVVMLYGINRHPFWGADVECFRPERWLDPASLSATNSTLASFSLGKRSCFGKVYAMMLMKTTLVHLVRNYRFIADHTKMQLAFTMVISPTNGHQVLLESRQ